MLRLGHCSLICGIAVLLAVPPAAAQSLPAPPTPNQNLGLNIGQSYHGEREEVNLATGNLYIELHPLPLPGRKGHDLDIPISYNSQVWKVVPFASPVNQNGNIGSIVFWEWTRPTNGGLTSGSGWSGFGQWPILLRDLQVQVYQVYIQASPDSHGTSYWRHEFCDTNYRVVTSDGGVHPFPGVQNNCYYDDHSSEPLVVPNVLVGDTEYHDSLWLRYDVNSGSLLWTNGDRWGGPGIEDPNGNFISASFYPGSATRASSYTDTVGRNIQLPYSSSSPAYPDSIVYKDSNGNTQTITLNYSSFTTQGAFSNPAPVANSGQPGTYAMAAMTCSASNPCQWSGMLTSIVLPNGLTYTFHYNSSFGELDQITYPSGGYTRYEYATFQHGVGNAQAQTPMAPWDYREVVAKHVCRAPVVPPGTLTYTALGTTPGNTCPVPEDTTTYSPTIGSNNINNASTTVTDPLGNITVIQFCNASPTQPCGWDPYETKRQIYDNAGHLLRTIDTTYTDNIGVYKASETITLDNGLVSKTEWDYQTGTRLASNPPRSPGSATDVTLSTGNVTERREFAYGQGAPGPLVRKADFTWGYGTPGAPFNNRKTGETVYDGANVVAQTTYEYDNYTQPIAASGATQHDSAYGTGYGTRGNVTAISRWRNTDAAWLTTRNQYDDAGNVVSITDPLNHTTSFDYTDSWGSAICAPATGHAAAYVSKITNALSQISSSAYNSCTGTVASNTDLNNQRTNYSYDLMGRLVQTLLPPDASGQRGETDVSYNDSVLPIKVVTSKKITSSLSAVSTIVLDGLARVTQTQLNSDPQGADLIDTTYDGLGRPISVSSPHRSAAALTDGVSQTQFDALGRVTQVTKQDGSVSTVSYTGNCTTGTDEAGKQRKSCSDALGRLIEVDEPNASSLGTDATASVSISGALYSSQGSDLAAAGSALTSFLDAGGTGHVAYLDSNSHIVNISLMYGGPLQSQDSTALSGAAPAIVGSKLASFNNAGVVVIVYQGTNQHIYQINGSGSTWVGSDLTAMAGTTVVAAAGTPLATYLNSSSEHFFYLGTDNHVYDLLWNGSTMSNLDLTALSGSAPAIATSKLASFVNMPVPVVVYQGGNQHIYAINWNGSSWVSQDLTAMANTTVVGASGTALATYLNSTSENFFYLGTDNHVYDLLWNGSTMSNLDLTTLSGAAPARAGSTLASFYNMFTQVVAYQGTNQHIYDVFGSGSSWVSQDLTAMAGTTMVGVPGTNLLNTASEDFFYQGTDRHVYELLWYGSRMRNIDMTPGPGPDSGTIALTVRDFTATVCFGPSTYPACNGQQQNVSAGDVTAALAQALNSSASPVTATVSGTTTLNLNWKVAGAFTPAIAPMTTTHDAPDLFPNPSFTSTAATFSGGTGPTWGTGSYVTQYQYDAVGNLLRVDQKGSAANDSTQWRTRLFSYDSLSRLLTAYNPESGTISYSYDANGNLLQKTSPAPNQTGSATQTISYCYDALNRVTGRAYSAQTCTNGLLPAGTAVVAYAYDQGTNGIGHMTGVTDQAGTGSYTYDNLGRIATETRVIAGISKGLSYSYNLDGSLKTLTYPSGATVTYSSDSAGRAVSAIDSANAINYVTAATYAPTGALASFVSGNSGSFYGIVSIFSYNSRLQPCRITATTGPWPNSCDDFGNIGNVLDLSYNFSFGGGDNGNVYALVNNRDHSRDQTFAYDSLNRLISAQNAGTDCSQKLLNQNQTKFWGNTYGYDAWGNLLSKSVTKCSAESLSLTALANNQVSGYSYDAAGNMTWDATDQVAAVYDPENRIATATKSGITTSYSYDGDGNRVEKSNGSTGRLYWYMTPGIVAESDLNGNLQSEYVFFGGERVARKDFPSNAVSYYFSDHLKTTDIVTAAQGNIKNESEFYPWGGELPFVANDSNHYKFTGEERDTETGLDYFGARYYSNGLGRFVSADWSATPVPVPYADLTDPQTLNLYGYVRGLPTTKADIGGHGFWNKLGNMLSDDGCWCDDEGLKRHRAEVEKKRREEYTKWRWQWIDSPWAKQWAKEHGGVTPAEAMNGMFFAAAGVQAGFGYGPEPTPPVPGEGEAEAAELQAYEEGAGHHVPAKSAFRGAAGYDPNKALAIPNAELQRLGISHADVTGAQMQLYKAFAQTGSKLTWEAVERIETQALVRGGMSEPMAQQTVQGAIGAMKSAGVSGPTRIPWGQ